MASVDTGRRIDGTVPVYGWRHRPGVPPVLVAGPCASPPEHRPLPHAHDFLLIGFVVRGGGAIRLDGRAWPLRANDLFLVGPGEVVDVSDTDTVGTVASQGGSTPAELWTAGFPPDAVDPGAMRSWRSHPLLFPFVRGPAGGAQRLPVPEADRDGMLARFTALDRELREPREGCAEAVLAHLTLLLVEVARLAADVPGGLRLRDEPVLAEVFDEVEAGFAGPLSLRDVALAVGLTPGHLTTVVRRRTGRTVGQWITERRMVEARRLLDTTDLTVAAVGARVGFRDPGYFIRSFRRAHGTAPRAWRRAGRRPVGQIMGTPSDG
ncbi:AraC family transcriptional regulator [Pseudonocardia sp.]|uniref:AraC family transcriptional regulator n=1 Tax=Pseudonocardia sp. TaxID=60912 RepID=UPI003D0A1091